jgi:hypothetical protein
MFYSLSNEFINLFNNYQIGGQINFMRTSTAGVYIWRDIASDDYISVDIYTKRLSHKGFDYKIREWLKEKYIIPTSDIIDLDGEEFDE